MTEGATTNYTLTYMPSFLRAPLKRRDFIGGNPNLTDDDELNDHKGAQKPARFIMKKEPLRQMSSRNCSAEPDLWNMRNLCTEFESVD